MKNLIRINMVAAAIIIVLAVLDLLFLFVLGYPAIFETIMLFGGIILAVIGGLIGLLIKKNNIQFEDNFISEKLGGISEYFNEFSTLIAAIALILSIFVIGYVNILTIGAALYTILTSIKYLQHN